MKRILVAPLDWGLGHATRCIPIVRELLSRNCEVILAGSGSSLALLKAEFPGLDYVVLPAYDPVYPRMGSMVSKMIRQIPKFIKTIHQEHQETEKLIRQKKIDVVIADNRYGCWSSAIPSVFITHQSNILMPKRFGWLQGLVRKLNISHMRKFTRCWIPDDPTGWLSGELISFGKIDAALNIDYIGALSRFAPSSPHVQKKYDIVAICSGPEPQRTLLENLILPELKRSGYKYFLVRGLPSAENQAHHNIADFLTANVLQTLIESADMVIARSGYSTIMDLQSLKKKAIFIPTPGQTEQEYLAAKLMQQRIAFSMDQKQFNLETALKESSQYTGFLSSPKDNGVLLKQAMDNILW